MSVEQVCDAGPGEEVLASLRTMFADRCRADARWLCALHEAGRAVAGRRERLRALDEFAGDEVASALGWSLSMAGRLLTLADDLLTRLPEVHAAMAAGVLELGKARVFSEWTRELEADHAHHVCAVVLPTAARRHVGELITEVQAVAAALDPEWAQRRLEAAKRAASVFGAMNPAGTANIVGRDLDPVSAVAAMTRIDTLAEALRCALRAHDVHHPVAWLRATVYQRLLDGTAAGDDDDALLDTLLTELTPPGDPGPDDDPRDDGPDDEPRDDGPRDGGDAEADGGDISAGGDLDRPAPETRRATRTGTVAIRMRLTTALGRDDTPAEVPTWGTVTAQVARTLIAQRHHGEWRLVLTDTDGHLEHLFLLRHRPDRADPRPPHHRDRLHTTPRAAPHRAIVELQIPTTALADLDPDRDDHRAWSAVLREAHARAARLPTLTPDDHPATTRGDAARRRARTDLDRWLRTRDRRCIGVMCTRTAHTADLDHTRDWAHGGITTAANLGALCRHCHRLKHLGRWSLDQPRPGHFRWTSRAGLAHDIRTRPLTPTLPAPRPRRDRRPRIPVEETLHPHHTRTDDPDHTPTWLTPDPRGAARPGPLDRADENTEVDA